MCYAPLQVLFTCLSHLRGQPHPACSSGPLPTFFPSSPSLLMTEVSRPLPLPLLQIQTDPGRGAGPHGLPNAHVEEGCPLRSRSQYADTPGAEKGDQERSHGEWPVILARPSGGSFSDVYLGVQDSLNCIPGQFKGQGSRHPQGTLRGQRANSALGWSGPDGQDGVAKTATLLAEPKGSRPGEHPEASEPPLPHSPVRAAETQTGQDTGCREGPVGWKPLSTRAGALPVGPARTACQPYLGVLLS